MKKYGNHKLRLTLILILLAVLYGLYINLFEGPNPIHEWRKADSLSITLNYMKGEPFFSPKTNLILENGNRNATAEFPIIYYLMGKLWSIIGQNEFAYRMFSLLLILGGIVAFSGVVQHYLKSERLTIVFSVFMFSSPVLIGYAHGFIPNPFAFAFMLFASYFVFQYIQTEKKAAILGFFVFSSLAVLIKITSILVVLAFAGAFVMFLMLHQRQAWKIHHRKILMLGSSIALTIVLTVFWYRYAIYYNAKYDSNLFSTTVRPIWEIAPDKQKLILEHILSFMLSHAYNRIVIALLFAFGIYALFSKSVHVYLKWLILMSFGAFLAYFALWFWVFDVHDYYLIEILFVFLVLFFVLLLKVKNSRIFENKRAINVSLSLFSLFVIAHAFSYSRMRFSDQPKFSVNNPFVNQQELDYWRWFHYDYTYNLRELHDKSADIRDIISPADTILCLQDHSPNVHLYTLDRIGYSRHLYSGFSDEEAILDASKRGARYVVFLGSEEERALVPYSDYTVYNSGRIYIFDLAPYKQNE
jgi:4-amino-4-deoxy-L-arabinose transferase-like glycosyltransferase